MRVCACACVSLSKLEHRTRSLSCRCHVCAHQGMLARACVCRRRKEPLRADPLPERVLAAGRALHTACVLDIAWRSRAPPGTASSCEVQATPLPSCPQAWSLPIQDSTELMARRVPCLPAQTPAVFQNAGRLLPLPSWAFPPTSLRPAYVLSLPTLRKPARPVQNAPSSWSPLSQPSSLSGPPGTMLHIHQAVRGPSFTQLTLSARL